MWEIIAETLTVVFGVDDFTPTDIVAGLKLAHESQKEIRLINQEDEFVKGLPLAGPADVMAFDDLRHFGYYAMASYGKYGTWLSSSQDHFD